MRQLALALSLAATIGLASGCLSQAPNAAGRVHTHNMPSQRQHISMTGVAKASASLISNNTAGLISNNTAGAVVKFAALSLEAIVPVAGAQATLVDQFRKPVPGVASVKTTQDGFFTFKNVPRGLTWTIEVTAPGLKLTRLARAEGGASVEVTPETTLATEHLHQKLASKKSALLTVSAPDFEALAAELKAVIDQADVASGLADSNAALVAFEKVSSKNPKVAERQEQAVQQATKAIEAAVQKGEVSAAEADGTHAPSAQASLPRHEATPRPEPTPAQPSKGRPADAAGGKDTGKPAGR